MTNQGQNNGQATGNNKKNPSPKVEEEPKTVQDDPGSQNSG